MKLEVGLYVRTKHCGLFKILNIIEENGSTKLLKKPGVVVEVENKKYKCYLEEEILKTSHNIIDLIEVGDYLNGFKVSKIERYDTNTIIKIGNSTFNVLEGEKIYTPSYDNNNGYEKIEKLKSIVTKEQFESMSYKVVEE